MDYLDKIEIYVGEGYEIDADAEKSEELEDEYEPNMPTEAEVRQYMEDNNIYTLDDIKKCENRKGFKADSVRMKNMIKVMYDLLGNDPV